MNFRSIFLFWCVVGCSAGAVHASSCDSLAVALRSEKTQISSEGHFREYANSFCSEYSKNKQISSQSGASVGYAGLSVGLSGADASLDAVYQKSCAGETYKGQGRSDFYLYIKSFDPQAYDVLDACVQHEQANVKFDVSPESVLATSLSIAVRSTLELGAAPTLIWTASQGVQCLTSLKSEGSKKFRGTVFLNCKRESQAQNDFVRVGIRNSVVPSLVIPWYSFSKEGQPQNVIKEIKSDLSMLAERDVVLEGKLVKSVEGLEQKTQAQLKNLGAFGAGSSGISGHKDSGMVWCPDGHYVAALRVIDNDGGKFCSSCLTNFEAVCRSLNHPK